MGEWVAGTVSKSLRIASVFGAFVSFASAYLYGYFHNFGNSFLSFVDAGSIISQLQYAALFAVYFLLMVRFQLLAIRAGLFGGSVRGRNNFRYEYRQGRLKSFGSGGTNYLSRLIVRTFEYYPVIFITIAGGYLLSNFLSFLNLISFFAVVGFYTITATGFIGILNNDTAIGAWRQLRKGVRLVLLKARTEPATLINLRGSITAAVTVLLFSAYVLGDMRYQTIAESEPVCIELEDYPTYGSIVLTSSLGVVVSKLQSDTEKKERVSELTFLPFETIKIIQSEC